MSFSFKNHPPLVRPETDHHVARHAHSTAGRRLRLAAAVRSPFATSRPANETALVAQSEAGGEAPQRATKGSGLVTVDADCLNEDPTNRDEASRADQALRMVTLANRADAILQSLTETGEPGTQPPDS